MDLSSIIDDLITGKAKLRRTDPPEVAAAVAGAAVDAEMFVCPQGALRLFLGGVLITVKTTGTALTLQLYRKGGLATGLVFVSGTIGSDTIAIPRDDGSTKDPSWVASTVPIIMQSGDYFRLGHGLTAGETITDTLTANFIEWQIAEEKGKTQEKKIEAARPMPTAGGAWWG